MLNGSLIENKAAARKHIFFVFLAVPSLFFYVNQFAWVRHKVLNLQPGIYSDLQKPFQFKEHLKSSGGLLSVREAALPRQRQPLDAPDIINLGALRDTDPHQTPPISRYLPHIFR